MLTSVVILWYGVKWCYHVPQKLEPVHPLQNDYYMKTRCHKPDAAGDVSFKWYLCQDVRNDTKEQITTHCTKSLPDTLSILMDKVTDSEIGYKSCGISMSRGQSSMTWICRTWILIIKVYKPYLFNYTRGSYNSNLVNGTIINQCIKSQFISVLGIGTSRNVSCLTLSEKIKEKIFIGLLYVISLSILKEEYTRYYWSECKRITNCSL